MVRRLLVRCGMVGVLVAGLLGRRSYDSWWRAPAVDGQLTTNGQGLPNAALFLQVPDFDSGLCEPPGQSATTDSGRADTMHLACSYPGLGMVTIDGTFPIRQAEDPSSGPRFIGMVTITQAGRTLHRGRHSFVFTIGE